MARKRKRKSSVPRVKRMKRSARLQSAVSWLTTFSGKNVLRGYCKHFAVDWRCGAIELRKLGVHLDPEYLAMRERTEQNLAIERRRRHEARANEDCLPDLFGLQGRAQCRLTSRRP